MGSPAVTASRAHRGTIFVEDAKILSQECFPGRQFVLRLAAPQCAARATAGSFAHVTVDPSIPMRRPLSIMRVDREQGWIELLYKVHGQGLGNLAARRVGDTVNLLGPIGQGFTPHADRPRALLIGGGVGIPPMVFLAETLRDRAAEGFRPFAILGSIAVSFRPVRRRSWCRACPTGSLPACRCSMTGACPAA
jgi:dihydroorotate dehydrogenase electron transfer subunit